MVPNTPSDRSEQKVLPNTDKSITEVRELKTKELCLDVLQSLNCQVSFDEDNPDRLIFNYQGENFIIEASDDYRMITIWDQFWYEIDLKDLDAVSRVRKAINSVNICTVPTMVYSFDEETQKMWVHTKMAALFEAEISDKQTYLTALFSVFFDVHRSLFSEIDRLKREEN